MNKWTFKITFVYLFIGFFVKVADSGSNGESGSFSQNGRLIK